MGQNTEHPNLQVTPLDCGEEMIRVEAEKLKRESVEDLIVPKSPQPSLESIDDKMILEEPASATQMIEDPIKQEVSKRFLQKKSMSHSGTETLRQEKKRRSSLVNSVVSMWHSVFSGSEDSDSSKLRKGKNSSKYPGGTKAKREGRYRDEAGSKNDYYCPVYVMLPLDTINDQGQIVNKPKLAFLLQKLKSGGTDGVMFDCWWGLVEKNLWNTISVLMRN